MTYATADTLEISTTAPWSYCGGSSFDLLFGSFSKC